jgi:hypothetical protein
MCKSGTNVGKTGVRQENIAFLHEGKNQFGGGGSMVLGPKYRPLLFSTVPHIVALKYILMLL